MFMYDIQRDTQSATYLFRPVKVIKFFLDMGPCDQQSHHAANTLRRDCFRLYMLMWSISVPKSLMVRRIIKRMFKYVLF